MDLSPKQILRVSSYQIYFLNYKSSFVTQEVRVFLHVELLIVLYGERRGFLFYEEFTIERILLGRLLLDGSYRAFKLWAEDCL